ncbi:MAG: hypothetical protein PHG00_17995 [Methylococcales bacterium]|nr:hypothetical protein [Methylococcales bacterium]
MNLVQVLKTQRHSISERVVQAWQQGGLEPKPKPLESALLLKRIAEGDRSGQFLADAFLSAYRGDTFDHSLKELLKLDAEAIRLFHEILHIPHVNGWADNSLYAVEKQIKEILASEF